MQGEARRGETRLLLISSGLFNCTDNFLFCFLQMGWDIIIYLYS